MAKLKKKIDIHSENDTNQKCPLPNVLSVLFNLSPSLLFHSANYILYISNIEYLICRSNTINNFSLFLHYHNYITVTIHSLFATILIVFLSHRPNPGQMHYSMHDIKISIYHTHKCIKMAEMTINVHASFYAEWN